MLKQSPMRSELRERHPARVWALAEAGWRDIHEGIENWRIWHLMGSAELRRRYARSRLGQFWLTLSTGILIGVPWPRVERFVENADVRDDALLCCQHDHLDDDNWLYRGRLDRVR